MVEFFLQQNIVVKVAMFDDKKTRKALKIAVGVSGETFESSSPFCPNFSPFSSLDDFYNT